MTVATTSTTSRDYRVGWRKCPDALALAIEVTDVTEAGDRR